MRPSSREVCVLAFAVLLAVAGVPVSPAGAAAQTTIDSCTTIDEPGTYVLTSGVDNGGKTPISQSCITITADGVTFDGNGHVLDGRGESQTKGVTVDGADDVTVRNVAVNDWHYGVFVTNGSANVESVRSFSNAYGVRLDDASGSSVTNNTVENNLVGIYADPGNDLTVSDNDVSDNQIAVKYVDRGGSDRLVSAVHPVRIRQ